ncbi:MAG TPA: glycosyltransferase [Candidatus Wallbacteria bacterium]|nr:MAG: D-inositol 3-phosphate glycosyltransferase [bacterium ADurb.Bin243]HPG56548.1 glycosyltransferase [Candidatus Wallbacteria bacterium]
MNISGLKVAIVHYWLVNMRGGEKVIEELLDIFPDAEIFTLVYDKSKISDKINSRKIHTSFIQNLPFGVSKYQHFFPLFPFAMEQFDLSKFDLVISSDSGFSKMALTNSRQKHVTYCHTPMRYAWDKYFEYLNENNLGFIKKSAMRIFMHYVRLTDLASSFRVDHFIANSKTVAGRVNKHYRRAAEVIYPPVDCKKFTIAPPSEEPSKDPFYLFVGQLIPYKKPDIAVKAFNELGLNLIVAGTGQMEKELRKTAAPNVKFIGRAEDARLLNLYQNCEALIFPNEEDFGIVPVECMAAGKPVIALNEGGASETVIDGKTGVLFDGCSVPSLIGAVKKFIAVRNGFRAEEIREHALEFDNEVFKSRIKRFFESL